MGKAIPGPHVGDVCANAKVIEIIPAQALRLYRYKTQCLSCGEVSTMGRAWLKEKNKKAIMHCAKCRQVKRQSDAVSKHIKSLLPYTGIVPWLPGRLAIAQAQKRHTAWGAR